MVETNENGQETDSALVILETKRRRLLQQILDTQATLAEEERAIHQRLNPQIVSQRAKLERAAKALFDFADRYALTHDLVTRYLGQYPDRAPSVGTIYAEISTTSEAELTNLRTFLTDSLDRPLRPSQLASRFGSWINESQPASPEIFAQLHPRSQQAFRQDVKRRFLERQEASKPQ